MGLFLRVVEAGLAVVALLVTHQLFWVLSVDLQRNWRCGNPPVLLLAVPRGAPPAGSRCGRRSEVVVSEPELRVVGYTASRKEVQIWANAAPVRKVYSGDGRFETIVPLRRGFNAIGASLDAPRRSPRAADYWTTTVNYRPQQPLGMRMIGVIPNDGAGRSVVGLGEPDSRVWLRTPDGRAVPTSTNVLGMFSFQLPGPPDRPVELRIAYAETDLAGGAATAWSAPPEPRLAVTRSVEIEVGDDGEYTMNFRATVPPETALEQYASRGQLTIREFTEDVFGLGIAVPETHSVPREARPEMVDPEQIRLKLAGNLGSTESLSMFWSANTLRPLAVASDEVVLKIKGTTATTIVQQPTTKSDDGRVLTWQGPYRWRERDTPLFTIGALRPRAAPSPTTAEPEDTLLSFLQRLRALVWEGPARLAWALLSAIPFIALLWILRGPAGGQSSAYRTDLRALALTFLLFHLAVQSWPVFELSFTRLQAILTGVGAASVDVRVAETFRDVARITPFLVVGVMLLIQPIYAAARRPETAVAPFHLWNAVRFVLWPAAVIVPIILFGALVKIRGSLGTLRRFETLSPAAVASPLAWFGAGALVVWIFLYWFLRVGPGVAIGFRAAIGTSLAMILLPALPWSLDSVAGLVRWNLAGGGEISPLLVPAEIEGGVWLLIILAIGTALLLHLSRMSAQVFTETTPVVMLWSWAGMGLIVLLALFSVPYQIVMGRAHVNVWSLTSLAYAISGLLPYALLAGMVLFLHKSNPADDFTISDEARHVGALMFAFFLAGRTANLVFLPVPVLLGWYAFARWLAPSRSADAAVAEPSARKDLIAKLLDYRRVRALVGDHRKGLAKKYADGTTTLTEYRMRLHEAERYVAQAAGALGGPLAAVKERIFSRGPGAGPWANAKTAMKMGTILSIPFQLVTLTNQFREVPVGNYPLLRFVESLAVSFSTWLVIACLFGYFFHLIPGRAGIDKAWIFGGVLLLATLPAAIIQPGTVPAREQVAQLLPVTTAVPWVAYVLVLAFVLVLALIFDVRTIQASGYSWQDLIAVHGLTTISAYASSIVVASVASIKGWDALKAIWDFIQKSLHAGLTK